MVDGFEHFEQQERSWSYLQDFGEKLGKEAAEVLATSPEAKLAGLVLEAGTSEFDQTRAAIEQATGRKPAGPGFLGVVPREVALTILQANAGSEAVKWFEENAPLFAGKLPIIVATKDGFRMAAVPIPQAE